MPGGKIQLINPSNIQDNYLTTPIHNYEYIYHQYNNFRKIHTVLIPDNSLNINKSIFDETKYKITVPKNGDLLSNLYLELMEIEFACEEFKIALDNKIVVAERKHEELCL